MKFPQVCASLAQRWCSAALKIDVFARYLRTLDQQGYDSGLIDRLRAAAKQEASHGVIDHPTHSLYWQAAEELYRMGCEHELALSMMDGLTRDLDRWIDAVDGSFPNSVRPT